MCLSQSIYVAHPAIQPASQEGKVVKNGKSFGVVRHGEIDAVISRYWICPRLLLVGPTVAYTGTQCNATNAREGQHTSHRYSPPKFALRIFAAAGRGVTSVQSRSLAGTPKKQNGQFCLAQAR